MDPRLEFVYYRDVPSDKQIAEDLSKLVAEYLKAHKIVTTNPSIRKGQADQAIRPLQFDIHIGPDIASDLIHDLTPGNR